MAKWARTELSEMLTLRDVIDYQFLNYTNDYYQMQSVIFFAAVILPMVIQLCISNEVSNPEYQFTKEAWAIRFCVLIPILT